MSINTNTSEQISLTPNQRLENVKNAMILADRTDGTTYYRITDECAPDLKKILMSIIYDENIGGDTDRSYEICASACDILDEKTIDGDDRDSLTSDSLDFYADADSKENVYTYPLLQYINVNNQQEISQILKDESHDSIAQAFASWHIQKVAEVCETLKTYILAE